VALPTYRSQQWLFDTAAGRYDVDLCISGMEARSVDRLLPDLDPKAPYDRDRGSEPLRQAIADRYGVGADEVLITHGAQEALYLSYAALLEPGDVVVARTPGWQQTLDLPARFGASTRTVPIDLSTSDSEGAARTVEAFGPDTRIALLNSPHNPTGLTWDEAYWKTVAAGLAEHDILLINDEEYVTDESQSTVRSVPGSATVGSLSKVYGFPGLRLGWLVGPADVVEACVNYRRYTTISNSPLLESLALAVLRNSAEYLDEYHERLATGWRIFSEWAAGFPQLSVTEPQGTPFTLARIELDLSSVELATRLLDDERLLVFPGDVFGAPGYLRISYARPEPVLRDGLDRLGRVLRAVR
jgi:aspartate/methionine/tyrosine aminotransferase